MDGSPAAGGTPCCGAWAVGPGLVRKVPRAGAEEGTCPPLRLAPSLGSSLQVTPLSVLICPSLPLFSSPFPAPRSVPVLGTGLWSEKRLGLPYLDP